MYVLFISWLALVPPFYGEEELYVYKDKEQCEWAKAWTQENNNIKNTFTLDCKEL